MTRRARRSSADMSRVQRSGASGEAVAASLHMAERVLGVATVRKLPTPLRIIGTCSRGLICCPEERSTVDHFGHMKDGTGRAVVVESKTLREGRFNFKSMLKPHQRDALDEATEDGCVAALLIFYGPLLTTHAIPWTRVRELIDSGAKSMTETDIREWEVPSGHSYLGRFSQRIERKAGA